MPGVYSGWVIFSNAGVPSVQDSPQRVFVSLTVQPQCALTVTPGVLTITDAYLQAAPAPISISVGSNQGCSTPVQWSASASTSTGGSWLNMSAASGTTPYTLAVSVNVTGLAVGTYSGQVVLTSTAGSFTVPVTFIMGQPTTPILATTPASLSFSGVVGQPNPATQGIAITNSGGGTLTWQASVTTAVGGTWLSVTPASGSLLANQTTTLGVSVATSGLIAGTYTGTITISATDSAGQAAAGSPQSLPVTFTFAPACTISATPVALTFDVLVKG